VSNVPATTARVRGPAHAPPPALPELPVCLISTDKRKTKLTSGTGHSSAPDAYSERSEEALPRLSVTSRVDVRRVMLRAGAPFVIIAPCYCPLVVAGWRTRTLHDPHLLLNQSFGRPITRTACPVSDSRTMWLSCSTLSAQNLKVSCPTNIPLEARRRAYCRGRSTASTGPSQGATSMPAWSRQSRRRSHTRLRPCTYCSPR
jgi:hypothetical protein